MRFFLIIAASLICVHVCVDAAVGALVALSAVDAGTADSRNDGLKAHPSIGSFHNPQGDGCTGSLSRRTLVPGSPGPVAGDSGTIVSEDSSQIIGGFDANTQESWQAGVRNPSITLEWFPHVARSTQSSGHLRVPEDVPNLSEAIAAAGNGDSIVIADGVFGGDGFRDISIGEKTITIASLNGPDYTTIDIGGSESEPHRAVNLHQRDVFSGEKHSVTFSGITFVNGYADEGAVAYGYQSIASFEHCVFLNNQAGRGGVVRAQGSILRFKGCRFENNAGELGVAIDGPGELTVDSCSFVGNSGSKSVICDCASASILSSTFVDNVSPGLLSGGNGSSWAVESCIFSNNRGSAFSSWQQNLVLSQCTLDGNTTGIELIQDTRVTIDRCIITTNTGYGVRCVAAGTDTPFESYLTIYDSDVYDNNYDIYSCGGAMADSSNVFSLDPLFCDPLMGDFELQTSSPCADVPAGGGFIGALPVGCVSTDVATETSLDFDVCLHQNYPNPFNSQTVISYSLPTRSTVRIDIYNALGRHVATLVNGERQIGNHRVFWDGTDVLGNGVASGVYFCRITAGSFTESMKLVLLR